MFTGIVTEIGRVEELRAGPEGARLRIAAALAEELREGDSVAVEGACLTVASRDGRAFAADVMNRTLELTSLGRLRPGAPVNLEPPLRAGEPLGGHIVQGHVDGVARVVGATDDGFARRLEVELPPELRPYAVERGSVTVAGVSLTVASVTASGLSVSLIPETLERTTLGAAQPGDVVNVEVDVLARYVGRLLGLREKGTS